MAKQKPRLEYDDREPEGGVVVPASWSSRRRFPIGMLAAAVAIWASATGEWLWGGVAAIALELINWFFSRRLQITFRTQRRAWLLLIFFLWWIGISAWLENTPIEAVRVVLTWAPFTMLPLVAVGIAGVRGGVPLTVFPYVFRARVRRYHRTGRDYEAPRFSPHLPFIALLLLGASYGWDRGTDERWWFQAISILMVVWVWVDESGRFRDVGTKRARRRRLPGFIAAISVVAVIATAGASGIKQVHDWVESGGLGGRSAMGRGSGNRASIQLGEVGEIQLSNEVYWRVKSLQGIAPDRLTDGVYDLIRTSVWINRSNRTFAPLGEVSGEVDIRESWPLSPMVGGSAPVTVEGSTVPMMWRFELYGAAMDELTVLPLPRSPLSASRLPAYDLERNGMGVVRARLAVPVVKSQMLAAPTRQPSIGVLAPNLENDLDLGENHEFTFVSLAADLGLKDMTDAEKVSAVHEFFNDGFSYSLSERPDDLMTFVTSERQGHCELYATATVLLLRAGGVPARYHTGFVLSEYDGGDESYVLRGRHAHAWAEAWINGSWHVVDTTPTGWEQVISPTSAWWSDMVDQLKLWMMDFRYWRSSLETAEWASSALPWAIVGVLLYIVIRVWVGRSELFKGQRADRLSRSSWTSEEWENLEPTCWDGLRPSVEQAFGEIPEPSGVSRWVRSNQRIPQALRRSLMAVVNSHYRMRFSHEEGDTEPSATRAVAEKIAMDLEADDKRAVCPPAVGGFQR